MKRMESIRQSNRIQRPPCQPPGLSIQPFELKGELTLEGRSAYAYPRQWNSTQWETIVDEDKVFVVHDMLLKYEGRGRDTFYVGLAGSLGWAFLQGNGYWEILDMQPAAQMIRGDYQGDYCHPGEGTCEDAWAIVDVEVVDPVGGILLRQDEIEYEVVGGTFSTFAVKYAYDLGITGGHATEPAGRVYAVRRVQEILGESGFGVTAYWEIVNYQRKKLGYY